MNNVIKMSLATAIMMSMGTVSAQAADEISIVDNVKVKGEIRPRYEMVDQEGKNNANALTNRLVIGVGGDIAGTDWLSGYAEMTDIHALNNNYYDTAGGAAIGDNGTPNTTAGVKDPEQTRVTQAYLDLKYGKTKLRVGRQMINLDDQRFVGAVAWRQMPQTFDAYTIMDNSVENLNLFASYIHQRHTVGFEDKKNQETILLNAKYKVMDALTVTGYGYLVSMHSDTYGLSLKGGFPVSDGLKLNYHAEYAKQGDASQDHDNGTAPDADSDYIKLGIGMNMSGILAGATYEVLGADTDTGATHGFETPLATLHKFNGWADIFLGGTPVDGLVDMNAMVGYKSKDLGLFKAIYHDFSSDEGSVDYGTELNLLYTRAIPGVKGLSGMLKYADYNADTYKVDTQKFWAMLTYKFSN